MKRTKIARLLLIIYVICLLGACAPETTSPDRAGSGTDRLATGELSVGRIHNEILAAFESRCSYAEVARTPGDLRLRIEEPLLRSVNEVFARHDLGAPVETDGLDAVFDLLDALRQGDFADAENLTWRTRRLGRSLVEWGVADEDAAIAVEFLADLLAARGESTDVVLAVIDDWHRLQVDPDKSDPLGPVAVMLDVASHSLAHWTAETAAGRADRKKPTPDAEVWIGVGDVLGAVVGLVWGPLGAILGGAAVSIACRLAEDSLAGDPCGT